MSKAPSRIGYARVSTTSQDTAIQIDKLKGAGCGVIRQEKVSGRTRDGRDELETVIDFLRPGDTLVVCKLDRLGRSTRDVLNLVHDIEAKGAHLEVLEPAISTSGTMGKMVLTVLGMVAEMELGFIKERQRAGIDRAKAEGIYKGGKPRLDRNAVWQAKDQGQSIAAIARAHHCSRQAVYDILSERRRKVGHLS
jgi:DNA invertase Pin-like site-specific DNA recombinase